LNYKILSGGKEGVFDLTPYCVGEAVLTTYKTGKASSLQFVVGRNLGGKFSFFEGYCIQLFADDQILFQGFVFAKERSSDHFIKVTAYDQLRYLRNRDTYSYSFKTASDLLLMIVKDFKLTYGQIDNSEYVISSRIEENKTLFDIILNAVDITYKNTGSYFVLFDIAGRLYFKNQKYMRLPNSLSVNKNNIIDFNCKTDIDSDTFSRVKLFQSNKKKEIFKTFVSENKEAIQNFGVLQYFEKVPDDYNEFQIKNSAETILKQKNRIKRSFDVKCINIGNGQQNIRAGNSILVENLDIGEEIINDWLSIIKCVHYFKADEHIIHMWF